jgi:hypothetical protein
LSEKTLTASALNKERERKKRSRMRRKVRRRTRERCAERETEREKRDAARGERFAGAPPLPGEGNAFWRNFY